jgi:preprotein translocase subunit SecE
MATSQVETVSTGADKAKLGAAIALVIAAFGRDSWKEVKKVVWPTRKEAIQMTAYVIAFCAVMALFLWLTDKTLEWVFYDLILGWKK